MVFDPSKAIKKMLGPGVNVPRFRQGRNARDTDGDGIPDIMDCQPRNMFRQDDPYKTKEGYKVDRTGLPKDFDIYTNDPWNYIKPPVILNGWKSLPRGDRGTILEYRTKYGNESFGDMDENAPRYKKGNSYLFIEYGEVSPHSDEGFFYNICKIGPDKRMTVLTSITGYKPKITMDKLKQIMMRY